MTPPCRPACTYTANRDIHLMSQYYTCTCWAYAHGLLASIRFRHRLVGVDVVDSVVLVLLMAGPVGDK